MTEHQTDTTPLTFGSRTDIGRVRDHNEDSLLVQPPLFVIADGMGGHAAGEIASELAVRTLENARIGSIDAEALRTAIIEANDVIIEGAQTGLGRAGMGTTLTAAVFEHDRVLIAQVGDSRAYLLHAGELRQVTRDHSLVEELVAAGQITEEEARFHPNRSVITRALGSDVNVLPDLYEIQVHEGDRLLLCSDGLSSMLDAGSICDVLRADADPQRAADTLVVAANDEGGYDNVTVIVVNVAKVSSLAEVRRKRRFKWGIFAFLLVFVLLVAGTAGGVYAYARNAAFLIDEGGYVTLYRGLPGEALGIELKWREDTPYRIKVSSLSPTFASELKDGIPVDSLDEALETLKKLDADQTIKR
jgi:protein phosphatase